MLGSFKSPSTKAFFLFVSYVLKTINNFNTEFQSQDPKIHLLMPRLRCILNTVLRCFVLNNKLVEPIETVDYKNIMNHVEIENVFIGTKAEQWLEVKLVKIDEIKRIKKLIKDFYIELCNQILKRFDFTNQALSAISWFDPEIALSGKISNITKILTVFPMFNSKSEEWRLIASTQNLNELNKEVTSFWTMLGTIKNSIGINLFSNISNVAKAVITLPHSSAVAERVFSQTNLTKTKLRNRLHTSTTSALLSAKDYLKFTESDKKFCFNWEPTQKMIDSEFKPNSEDVEVEDDL